MTSDFSARSRLYQDALFEALTGSSTAVAGAEPLHLLGATISRCRPLVPDAEHAAEALDALAAVAAQPGLDAGLSDAAARFESPQRFREALFFLRCLERDSDAALALLDARAYLEGAAVPAATYPRLAADQAALLDATTFDALWREPEGQRPFLDSIAAWRHEYIPAYREHHASFNEALTALATQIEGLKSRAVALERLNSLERLGGSQSVVALDSFYELDGLAACPTDAAGLSGALAAAPVCPYCAYRLGEEPPAEDVSRVQDAIEQGLSHQQSRLARLVLPRLARSGRAGSERLQRLVVSVKGADTASLAAALDEGLVAFLRDLLDAPAPSRTLLDRLAASYPEITAANLDDALAELRLLIQAELRQNDGRLLLARLDPDA